MKIVLKSLTKIFSNKETRREVRVVDNLDVDVSLEPFENDKSTILRIIDRLYKSTKKERYFDERFVAHRPPEKRRIGLIFQNYKLYPYLIIEENIILPSLSQNENQNIRRKFYV